MDKVCKPPGQQALRRGRASLCGQQYLVTSVTKGRACLFSDHEMALAAARALTDPHALRSSRILCWVLMPDHWHGLVELGEGDALSRIMRDLKANSASAVNRVRQSEETVWARGYHDRALRSDEDVRAVARYVVANPVRAGLVRRVMDYPFWDAVWI